MQLAGCWCLLQLVSGVNLEEWLPLSSSPRVFVRDNFLNKAECDHLRTLALQSGRFRSAFVSNDARSSNAGQAFHRDAQIRGNTHLYLESEDEAASSTLQDVLERMHLAARMPPDSGEKLQIARYRPGERYEMHHDSGPEVGLARPATLIVYLNDVEAGGETIFPLSREVLLQCRPVHHADADGHSRFGIENCCNLRLPELLRVAPREGRAVLFFNHHLLGEKDVRAVHASCPVLSGEKWLAQRWFRFESHFGTASASNMASKALCLDRRCSADGEREQGGILTTMLRARPRVYMFDHALTPDENSRLSSWAASMQPPVAPGQMLEVPQTTGHQDQVLLEQLRKRMHELARVPYADPYEASVTLTRSRAEGLPALEVDHSSEPLVMVLFLHENTSTGTSESDAVGQRPGSLVLPLGICATPAECCGAAGARMQPGPLQVLPKAGRAVLVALRRLDGAPDALASLGAPRSSFVKMDQNWIETGPKLDQNWIATICCFARDV
ncbi:P4H6 [Symbiodinium natans]|uniref:P4H6 protein n=1 Tax=Symbiodinium natans TaxID=878477 RepID=A0A812LG92_9DINO|nr:P4H6 [Symbiodinium natans]